MAEKKGGEASKPQKLTVKDWAAEDRPREKLMRFGAEALSDAELFAVLIGSGSPRESAVDLMKHVLNDCDNNLSLLNRLTAEQLMGYEGIGEAKAVTILAACELSKRRARYGMPERKVLDSPRAIYEYLWPQVRDLDVEESYVVLMTQSFREIKTRRLSQGGITETAVDVRLVVKEALMCNAPVVVLVHNHPSGSVQPSRNDDALTRKLDEACRLMRLYFSDHVIITDGGYYSYREEGKL